MITGAVADYRRPSPPSIIEKRDVDITTIQDKILEYNETFAVSIPSDLIHSSLAAADCITTVDVLIVNDDCKLQRNEYVGPLYNYIRNLLAYYIYV